MPIDTNIALGIRPVEQPNMLAQMGQVMQLRQLQQENDSQNALSDSYRQAYAGGKFDPQAVIRGLVNSGQGHLVPKVEAQMLKAEQERAATKKTTVETLAKEYENLNVGLRNVTDENGYLNWVKSGFNNPAIAAHMKEMGITPEMALANAQAEVAKNGLSNAIAKSSMGVSRFMEQDLQLKNAVKTANIGAAAPLQQAQLAREKFAYERANPVMNQVTTDQGLGVTPNRGPNAGRIQPIYEPSAAPPPPAANAFSQQPNQNMLTVAPPASVPLSTMTGAAPVAPAPVAPVRAQPIQSGTMAGYRKLSNGNMELIPGGPADPNVKAPEGYRRTATGDLEAIPGGPKDPNVQAQQAEVKLSAKDIAAREAKYPQATTALNGFEAKTAKFERDIDELLANKKGLDEITGYIAGRTNLSAMSKEGQRALALYNTITAKGGFSELQDMRNSSPTGGALGNISNQEGKQLIDSVGALSRTQDASDLRKSLGILKTDLQGAKQRVRDAYDLTYEYKGSGAGSQPSTAKEDPLGIR